MKAKSAKNSVALSIDWQYIVKKFILICLLKDSNQTTYSMNLDKFFTLSSLVSYLANLKVQVVLIIIIIVQVDLETYFVAD